MAQSGVWAFMVVSNASSLPCPPGPDRSRPLPLQSSPLHSGYDEAAPGVCSIQDGHPRLDVSDPRSLYEGAPLLTEELAAVVVDNLGFVVPAMG